MYDPELINDIDLVEPPGSDNKNIYGEINDQLLKQYSRVSNKYSGKTVEVSFLPDWVEIIHNEEFYTGKNYDPSRIVCKVCIDPANAKNKPIISKNIRTRRQNKRKK